jgi:hypothetical protein
MQNERTLPQLTRDLGRQLSELLRQEVRLARIEAMDSVRGVGVGAAFGVGALVCAIAALTMAFAALAALISNWTPVWLALLIAAVAAAIVAAGCAQAARRRLSADRLGLPRTAAQLRSDIELVKEQAGS